MLTELILQKFTNIEYNQFHLEYNVIYVTSWHFREKEKDLKLI